MGIYDRDHRQNDPWKKNQQSNNTYKFNESKGEMEVDNLGSSKKMSSDEIKQYYENISNISEKHSKRNLQDDIRDFNQSASARRKLKEFKQTWKIQEKSQKRFSFFPWILVILVILIISKAIRNNHTVEANDAIAPVANGVIEKSDAASKSVPTVPMPLTSVLSKTYNDEMARCPLKIIANNENYYIKICDALREDKTVAILFVRAGEELNTKIPSGSFKLKFGAGNEWLGEQELFGAFSRYDETEILNFSDYGYESNGHTISFYNSVNGNFHTNNIGRDAVISN
ncbi:MAG: hypothetical protein AB7U26_02825 [Sulfuricurvum sp.]